MIGILSAKGFAYKNTLQTDDVVDAMADALGGLAFAVQQIAHKSFSAVRFAEEVKERIPKMQQLSAALAQNTKDITTKEQRIEYDSQLEKKARKRGIWA